MSCEVSCLFKIFRFDSIWFDTSPTSSFGRRTSKLKVVFAQRHHHWSSVVHHCWMSTTGFSSSASRSWNKYHTTTRLCRPCRFLHSFEGSSFQPCRTQLSVNYQTLRALFFLPTCLELAIFTSVSPLSSQPPLAIYTHDKGVRKSERWTDEPKHRTGHNKQHDDHNCSINGRCHPVRHSQSLLHYLGSEVHHLLQWYSAAGRYRMSSSSSSSSSSFYLLIWYVVTFCILQDRQGCRALTAALTQNINQINQYRRVHVITIKT